MNFFVDECLSDELTEMALARGHWGAASVKRRGLLGSKDWELMPFLIEGDFTFVTRNAIDFRGPADAPGSKGLYARESLHAGLVCLDGPPGMDLDMQKELFAIALDEIERIGGDLTNKVLDVSLESVDGDVVVRLYDLPRM